MYCLHIRYMSPVIVIVNVLPYSSNDLSQMYDFAVLLYGCDPCCHTHL